MWQTCHGTPRSTGSSSGSVNPVINEDDEGEPKVKARAREDGSSSGEGLVVFFEEDSVTPALSLRSDE